MKDELIRLLAGRRGHFAMESGYHSEWWFELNALLAKRELLRPFVSELARRVSLHDVEVICGPMTGGAQLAEMIGAELNLPVAFSERFEPADAKGLFPIRYAIPSNQRERVRGRRVAIVDDAVSAGSAVRGTFADAVACGGIPVAMGALFIFGNAAEEFAARHNLRLEGIAPLPFATWKPEDCPHCRAGEPLEKVSDAV